MYQTARKILRGLLTLTLLFLQPLLTTASTSPTNSLSTTATTRTITATSIPPVDHAASAHETSTTASLPPTNDPAPALETITVTVAPAQRRQDTITVVTSCIGYNTDAAGSTYCYPNPEPTHTTTIIVPSSAHTLFPSMNDLLVPGTLAMALVVGVVPALLFVLVLRLGWVRLYFQGGLGNFVGRVQVLIRGKHYI